MQGIQEYIKAFADQAKMSIKQLSDQLGYRNKSSLEHILSGKAAPDSVRKLERLLNQTFDLSKEERDALHEAAQITIHGEEKYLAMRQMWSFVQGERPQEQKALHIRNARTGAAVDLLNRCACGQNGLKSVQITVVNSQYVTALFDVLQKLLEDENVTVEHYLFSNEDAVRTIGSVCSLMPVFYEKNYSGFVRFRSGQEHTGLNESDFMIIRRNYAEVPDQMDLIWWTDAENGALMEVPAVENLPQQLNLKPSLYVPIKRTYFSCTALEDYIQYSRDYAALEQGRSVWKIKPDAGVDQIPTWILRQAMRDGDAAQDEQFSKILPILSDIYEKRYEDTYSKHAPAYTIFKRGAFQEFARTGRTSDHFWAMRPYTPQERIAILQDLVKRQTTNPYVHFYFLKEDSTLRDVEIAYYEDIGMLILPSDTDYNLPEGHTEIMITHPEMLKMFREFYSEVLLSEYVYSEKETTSFLNELILEVTQLEA